MFGKLGEILKKTTDKIANAIFLDKNLVESIIKDLQRALLEADVNVHLVKELSEKLRKIAFDERLKGIEKKEHLIKALHDELLILLGKEEKQLELGKKTKIMLLGLYGTGKCIHGETKVQLSSGEMPKIRELYSHYSKNLREEDLKDGKIIDISKLGLEVPSFNPKTLKIETKKATHLWKLNKKELIKINLDNGNDYSIKVTPEHPFFVLRNGKVVQIRAGEINSEDFVAVPQDIKIGGKAISLHEKIKELNLFVYLNKEEADKIIQEKNKSIKELCKRLKNKLNYCQLTKDLKIGKIPIEFVEIKKFNFIKTKYYTAQDALTIPLYMNSEFAEFLGYLIGDGHIGKNYVEIVSEDLEVIHRIIELSRVIFNITPKVKRDFRTGAMYKIQISSKTLVEILKIFNLFSGKKGKKLKIPEEILKSKENVVRAFIKAYFDCDSSPEKGRRNIELVSESQVIIEQMSMLLKRFGIVSTTSNKLVNNVKYWRLSIKAKYAEKYADKIGYLIKYKKERAEQYKTIGTLEGCGKQDMIYLGTVLKEIRQKLGFSIGEIQSNAVYSYGRYEERGFISREKLLKLICYYKLKKHGIFSELLKDIQNGVNLKNKYPNYFINGVSSWLKNSNIIEVAEGKILLSTNGKSYLNEIENNNLNSEILALENLALSNVCWLPIKEIKPVVNDEEHVYDLTVEDNHSFIAEGFIVHNTTTIAKLANYYAKRGKKTCMLGLDVHRPAAQDQLEQLAKQHNLAVFTDNKEKSPEKIYKKFQKEMEKYDVVLIDTAGRHTLDKELINEIKILNKPINPDYKILTISADIGQSAKKIASEFQQALEINGVIITRMDSTAKGGGALTACSETKAPVFFITTGEKINDIETFSPSSFISRILGMGDLKSLLEKVQSVVDEKSQAKLKEKLEQGKFDMNDLYKQLESMQNIGSLSKIKELIPGLGNAKIPDNLLGTQEEKLKKYKFIIQSMTKQEIENPEIIEKQTSRIARIAKGSGCHTSDVRSLLKQYKLIKEFTKGGISEEQLATQGFSQKQMMKLAKKFGKKMRL